VIVDSLVLAADGLLEALDAAGVERAVVCPPRARGHGYDVENDRVAELAGAHPERLVGFARVDPLAPGAAAELERALGLGLRVLYLHPWEDAFAITDAAVDPLLGEAPVIVATGYPWVSEGLQVGELARRHPQTRVVATNGAQLNVSGLGQRDALLALEASPNLLIQTTGVYREDFLEGVVARFGPERVLFASGWPRFDPRLERLRVEWAPGLDGDSKGAILHRNAARLLGWPERSRNGRNRPGGDGDTS
jgi:predicted TIM-barrel fold metal-dependent hydrolase